MNVVKEILNKYNVLFYKDDKLIVVKGPISVKEFVFLKNTLKQSTYDIEEIKVV